MTEENRVLFLANEVVSFVWKKHALRPINLEKLDEASPRPLDYNELPVEDVRKIVWVQIFVMQTKWKEFMKIHYNRMKSSFELFAQYAVHSCYVVKEAEENPYDRFLSVFAILTYFPIYIEKRSGEPTHFVQIVTEILVKFFVRELIAGFQSLDGWKGFREHLKRSPFLKKYEAVGEYLAQQGKSINGVCADVLRVPTDQRLGTKILKDITREEVESDEFARYISGDYQDYQPIPVSATRAKKGKKKSKGFYAPLPQASDDGPSAEVVDHLFGKQFTFVGDNIVYKGRTAREAIMRKSKECLALVYDEMDFTNFLIDLALKDLDKKVAELKQTTRAL